MDFDFGGMIAAFPTILSGLGNTLMISVAGIALGVMLGIAVGLIRSGKHNILYHIATLYVELVRGTPLMVQALYVYFAIPTIFDFHLPILPAGVLIIGLNSGAYLSESVRGAIQAVDQGQCEAGICLGLGRGRIMAGIIFPQAFRTMLPNLTNQFIISVKDTSLLNVIGLAEMTREATQLVSQTFLAVEIYTALAIVYLILIRLLSWALSILERRLK